MRLYFRIFILLIAFFVVAIQFTGIVSERDSGGARFVYDILRFGYPAAVYCSYDDMLIKKYWNKTFKWHEPQFFMWEQKKWIDHPYCYRLFHYPFDIYNRYVKNMIYNDHFNPLIQPRLPGLIVNTAYVLLTFMCVHYLFYQQIFRRPYHWVIFLVVCQLFLIYGIYDIVTAEYFHWRNTYWFVLITQYMNCFGLFMNLLCIIECTSKSFRRSVEVNTKDSV